MTDRKFFFSTSNQATNSSGSHDSKLLPCLLFMPFNATILGNKLHLILLSVPDDMSVWVKKDLAMFMVSAILIIFVICMLLTGLILRLRQCHSRRQFEREQERRRLATYDTESQTSSSSLDDTDKKDAPPPRYSDIIMDEEGDVTSTRTLCLRQDSADSTGALCSNNSINPQINHTDIMKDLKATTATLRLTPELLKSPSKSDIELDSTSQDTLFTLMDHSDCIKTFDSGVLAFQPLPDYDEAVEELEKRCGIQKVVLSPMPPAYSELSLHV